MAWLQWTKYWWNTGKNLGWYITFYLSHKKTIKEALRVAGENLSLLKHTFLVFASGLIRILLSNFTDHVEGLSDEFLLDSFQAAVLLKHFSWNIEWQCVGINKTLHQFEKIMTLVSPYFRKTQLEELIKDLHTFKKLRYLGKSSSNSSEMKTLLTYNFKLALLVL